MIVLGLALLVVKRFFADVVNQKEYNQKRRKDNTDNGQDNHQKSVFGAFHREHLLLVSVPIFFSVSEFTESVDGENNNSGNAVQDEGEAPAEEPENLGEDFHIINSFTGSLDLVLQPFYYSTISRLCQSYDKIRV